VLADMRQLNKIMGLSAGCGRSARKPGMTGRNGLSIPTIPECSSVEWVPELTGIFFAVQRALG
jgi:hypothetical protein